MNHFQLVDGVMHCEQVSLPRIAEAVGTPVYIYSVAAMRGQAAMLRAALEPLPDPLIAYAVKANPNGAVLATLAREGLGADIVSGGEYRCARAAGIDPDKIVFSGVGKTEEEMALALRGGLYQFNLESLEEAETLSAIATSLGLRARVALRINPDVLAGSHAKISTGAADNKFGVPLADAVATYGAAAALPGLDAQGVALHIGSQLTSLAPLESAFEKLGVLIGQLRAAGHVIKVVDLGGGLGIAYDPAAPLPPSADDYGRMVRRIAADWDVRLVFEPGRFIIGNAGILLAKVIRMKSGVAHPFMIVDAAMNDLMRPALYDAWHAIEAVVPTGKSNIVNVVGPVCETGDTFAMARRMDAVDAGGLVLFRTAGAYAAAMSNTYNSRPLAPEVLVNGDKWAVVRKRVEIGPLVGENIVPEWLA